MATRVRKTASATPTEVPTEPAVTTRRRASTSRTVATRRAASSSRSQRILIGTEPAEPAMVATEESAPVAAATSTTAESAVVAPAEIVVSAPSPPSAAAALSDLGLGEQVHALHKLLSDGQERLSQELLKAQSQTVRNVSGLAHDVDRLMNQVQGLVTRVQQTEALLTRIEGTLGPLARGISTMLLPVRPGDRPVSTEHLEKGLATALAPLLAELVELRSQRARDSSLAQVEQQILLTELRRLRAVAIPAPERVTDPLSSVGKTPRRSAPKSD